MTNWYNVTDSRVDQPEEVDTTSSSTVVYLRRNIRKSGNYWLYEQMEFTPEEYSLFGDKSGRAKSFTVTLPAAGWSSNAQTVTNGNFIVNGYAYTVTPDADSYNTYVQCGIRAHNVTTNGEMIFICNTAPTSAVTVNVTRMEATS